MKYNNTNTLMNWFIQLFKHDHKWKTRCYGSAIIRLCDCGELEHLNEDA